MTPLDEGEEAEWVVVIIGLSHAVSVALYQPGRGGALAGGVLRPADPRDWYVFPGMRRYRLDEEEIADLASLYLLGASRHDIDEWVAGKLRAMLPPGTFE